MNHLNSNGFETQLIAAFARHSAPVSDSGFTRRVMGGVNRRQIVRGLVLGLAWIGGGLLAGMTTAATIPNIAAVVRAITSGLPDSGWFATCQTLLVGVLGGVATIGMTRLLED